MHKTHYSCAELAALKLPGYPNSKRGFINLVERESWPYRNRNGRGGGREYLPTEPVAKLIAKHTRIQAEGAEARVILEARNLARGQRKADEARKSAVATEQLMGTLTPNGRDKFNARYDVLLAYRDWYAEQLAEHPKLGRKESFAQFAEAWKAGLVKASEEARQLYPDFSARSIERWVGDSEKDGMAPVADKWCRKSDGSRSVFGKIPILEKVLIALLSERPYIKTVHLVELINQKRVDEETGEVLFPPVSYHQVHRYREKWERQNAASHLLNRNPDAFKNKLLSAHGKADADVAHLNQRWEMDGTKADWMLRGGRYNASVVIDVWSRRPLIRFSKTPRTETNKQLLRDAVLDWGVPEEVATDNGSDYKNRELRLFFDEMGIAHHLCAPYSPWQKPHVERFIQTWQHGLLELLDAFIGHNVMERSALEARRTFAERLSTEGAAVEVDMTVEELQALTDAWIEGTYMHAEHSGLGMTPFARIASSTTPVKRVENERALDILLMKPAKKPPVITKQGIRYEKITYIHPELALPSRIGKAADIRLDPNDMGRIYVRVEGKFICVAENTALLGIKRAEYAAKARSVQREWIKEDKARARAAKKGLNADQTIGQILMDRAEEAGKLTHLQRSDAYTSDGLQEAERAMELDAAPKRSPEGDRLIAEAKQYLAAMTNPKAPVLQMSEHRAAQLASSAENPLSSLTDEQKFELWHVLDATARDGNGLPHDWQRIFHERFPKTSAFAAMRSMREEFGEGSGWPAAAATADRPV